MSRCTPSYSLFFVLLAGCVGEPEPDLSSTAQAIDISAFQLPSLDAAARATIVHRYDQLDPTDIVPRGLLEDAILYFDVNQAHIPKTSLMTVVELSKYSGQDRFWLVNLTTGAVEKHKVAHGDGSDPNNDGYATAFGNTDGSHMSSLGFYLTGEIYDGTHPHSMRLDGLSADGSPNGMANTNVRNRLIVVHEASYVSDTNTSQQGRSNGCFALDPSIEAGIVDRIHDGTLLYAAKSPLNTPVGRASCGDGLCDASETEAGCAADCSTPADDPGTSSPTDPTQDESDDADVSTGCSATGSGSGATLVLALAGLLGPRRRRRRT